MNRRQFLSISALPLVAATGFKVNAKLKPKVVAVPFALRKREGYRNQFFSAADAIGSAKSEKEPVFYYYRSGEFVVAHQAFELGLVDEIWTTPTMLTRLDRRFNFTNAMRPVASDLGKLSRSVRAFMNHKVSLSYFSLPAGKFYFAQTTDRPPESVHCFHPFRQTLFGAVEHPQNAILDSLPLYMIKKRPELNGVELHLDTFSRSISLGLIIKRDLRQLDSTSAVNFSAREPQVPEYLEAVYKLFKKNAVGTIEKYGPGAISDAEVILG